MFKCPACSSNFERMIGYESDALEHKCIFGYEFYIQNPPRKNLITLYLNEVVIQTDLDLKTTYISHNYAEEDFKWLCLEFETDLEKLCEKIKIVSFYA